MLKLTKRKVSFLVLLAAWLVIAAAVSGCGFQQIAETAAKREAQEEAPKTEIGAFLERPEVVTSGEEAKKLLEEGNSRFTSGKLANIDLGNQKREKLLAGQKPFAVIVSCSDSRVPPELLFDQGLGDLFVIRVAGNVVDPDVLGSIEYAVEHLHSPLVVVMGHEKCGAVTAAVEGGEAPGSIGAIVEKIAPAVAKAKSAGATGEELVEESIDENVVAMVAQIKASPIVKEAEEDGHVEVLGAQYHLGSGQVEWFAE